MQRSIDVQVVHLNGDLRIRTFDSLPDAERWMQVQKAIHGSGAVTLIWDKQPTNLFK